jgi:hypothetical protein
MEDADISLHDWLLAAVSATEEVAETALACQAGPLPQEAGGLGDDFCGSHIALFSDAGSLQISLLSTPEGCAALCRELLGMTPEEAELETAEVADAFGEIANLLAGSMKTQLNDKVKGLSLGLPVFISGQILRRRDERIESSLLRVGDVPARIEVARRESAAR